MEKIVNNLGLDEKRNKLWDKNFILLFFGKLVSQVGDAIYNIAIGWFILSYTNSAVQMAIYMALGTITYVVACPIGGIISDKMKRKGLIVSMDLIRGITVSVVGTCMYFGFVNIWLFYLASVILSICGAIFVPASNALVPKIVEDKKLTKANSIMFSVNGISNISGMILGGFLYALIGIKGIFLINAISYILSGVSEKFIRVKESGIKFKEIDFNHRALKEDFAIGFKEFSSNKGVFKLVWFASLLNLLIVPLFSTFIPFIFNQVIKSDVSHLSFVNAAMASGGIIGGILLSIIPEKEKIFKNIFIGFAGFNVMTAIIFVLFKAYSNGSISYQIFLMGLIGAFLLLGIASSTMNIPLMSIIQRKISNENLGKTFAVINTISMMTMPLGMMIGGVMADYNSMDMNLLIIFVPQLIVTWMLLSQKDIRRL